jgi:hypothetical protein
MIRRFIAGGVIAAAVGLVAWQDSHSEARAYERLTPAQRAAVDQEAQFLFGETLARMPARERLFIRGRLAKCGADGVSSADPTPAHPFGDPLCN